jgi:hypothetical protein
MMPKVAQEVVKNAGVSVEEIVANHLERELQLIPCYPVPVKSGVVFVEI